MKKLNTLLLLSLIAGTLSAQPTFKLYPTPPTREETDLQAWGNGKFLLKETKLGASKIGTGKLTLRDGQNKVLAATTYKQTFSALTFPSFMTIMQKDRLLCFSARASSNTYSSQYQLYDHDNLADLTLEQRDIKTLAVSGTPRLIFGMDKKIPYQFTLIRSDNNQRFALVKNEYYKFPTINYRLMNENFEEIFAHDYVIPYTNDSYFTPLGDPKMNDNGNVVFLLTPDYCTLKSKVYIAVITASTQKLLTKEVAVKGKLVWSNGAFTTNKKGEILVATTYGSPDKKYLSDMDGVVIERYSSELELLEHKEIPFSAETLKKCETSENLGDPTKTLRDQYVEDILELSSGYVVMTNQMVKHAEGKRQGYYENHYNNVVAIGLSEKMEPLYQNVAHQVNGKEVFVQLNSSGWYASGDNIYVFHPGKDAAAKNTKDEFDVFCTYWNHTTPANMQTVEVERPYPDLDLGLRSMKVLSENNLLFYGSGNGGNVITTMQIENK